MGAGYERWVPLPQWRGDDRGAFESLVERVRDRTRFRVRWLHGKSAELRSPASLLSWGEWVRLESLPGGIRVSSECSFPFQGVDWGKNRANVERVEGVVRCFLDGRGATDESRSS
jgi:hypothetical protein